MILTCPACATRYQADTAKFPAAGRQVRCAKCGHVWHQAAPLPEDENQPSPTRAAPAAPPTMAATLPSRARAAAAPPPPPREPRRAWLPALGVGLGWLILLAGIAALGYGALRYRQQVVLIWPQSAGVYAALGLDVNMQGIDFSQVAYHRQTEDGQSVLTVTGRIVNRGLRELPVPQSVRVSLSDAGGHELYHWTFTPAARTLGPGKAVAFLTRLPDPPAAARHLEVRFASEGP